MSKPEFEVEVDRYVEATAHLWLESQDLPASLWGFKREVLKLARHAWPPEAVAWFEQAEKISSRQEIDELVGRIAKYRTEVLGESLSGDVEHSEAAALTFLFSLMFYLPVSGELTQTARAALSYFIDEFSIEFISHFGRAQEVVDALRNNFQASEA